MLFICAILIAYILIWFIAKFNTYLQQYSKNQHLRFAFGIAAIVIGSLHIILPSFFGHLFSTVFKSTYNVITISGFIQIICGVGLLIKRVHREAAFLLIILLALFIPLSILMLTKYIPGPLGPEYEPVLGYLRILSFPLLIWILFHACELSPRKGLKNKRFDMDI